MPGKERVGDVSPYLLKKELEESEPEGSHSLFEVWQAKRRQAQTNLFWLCGILNYAVTEKAHRDMCDNFFQRKNPDTPLDEFSPDKKDFLLFAPRDGFKSSIANADFVQYIICWPNIKLAVQSSKIDRATPFVQEIKNFFLVREEPDGNLCLNTRFAILFPEHLLPERSRGADGEFTTPARVRFSKEPTCLSLGIEESRASVHFHVLRSDDAISESNSGQESSPEARANVGKKLLESRNLGDIRYYIGTPQDTGDGYSMLQENLGDDLVVTVKSGWRVKDEFAKKAEAELTEQHYDLWFPYDAKGKPKLTFKTLKGFQRADSTRFATQQLCRSVLQKEKIEISTSLIESHILPAAFDYLALNPSPVISAWDLSYITGNSSPRADYCVGCAGLRDEFRGAVVRDIQRGQYLKHDLIRAMVTQAVQFRVNTIWIEGTNGTHFIYDDLIAALRLAGASITKVDFIGVDNQFDAKAIRFRTIYDALKQNELWFALGPAQVAILYELTKARGKKRDDVDDSLAHLIAKLKEPLDTRPKEVPASQAQIILQEKRLRDMVYGLRDANGLPTEEKLSPWWNERDPSRFPKPQVEEEIPKEFEGMPVFRNESEWLYKER
jgi:hypothetical protein